MKCGFACTNVRSRLSRRKWKSLEIFLKNNSQNISQWHDFVTWVSVDTGSSPLSNSEWEVGVIRKLTPRGTFDMLPLIFQSIWRKEKNLPYLQNRGPWSQCRRDAWQIRNCRTACGRWRLSRRGSHHDSFLGIEASIGLHQSQKLPRMELFEMGTMTRWSWYKILV